MGYRTFAQTLLVAFVLILSGNSQSFAQFSNERDEGTAKRSYGDPLPGQDGAAPGIQGMSIVEAASPAVWRKRGARSCWARA